MLGMPREKNATHLKRTANVIEGFLLYLYFDNLKKCNNIAKNCRHGVIMLKFSFS